MADDLVLTLRNEADEFFMPVSAAVAMERAADEIERLRAEVAGWKEQHGRDSVELRRLCASRDEAERELAELRERFEMAPIRCVLNDGQFDYIGCSTLGLLGHRVRLVRDD